MKFRNKKFRYGVPVHFEHCFPLYFLPSFHRFYTFSSDPLNYAARILCKDQVNCFSFCYINASSRINSENYIKEQNCVNKETIAIQSRCVPANYHIILLFPFCFLLTQLKPIRSICLTPVCFTFSGPNTCLI
jgi:hypothetical protein